MVDVLQDRLIRARAAGASFVQSAVDPPWGLQLPAVTQLAAHAMIRGDGWIWLGDRSGAIELRAGDLALVRGDQVHHLTSGPDAAYIHFEDFRRQTADSPPDHRSSTNLFLCGTYGFAGDVGRGLVEALPPILHLRPRPGDRLRTAAELLSLELADPQPGQQTVLDRLLDIVLVQSLRHHFDDPKVAAPGWYAAGAHPHLQKPLQAIHDHPEHPWTVVELARLATVSRATFTREFNDVLGQTPIGYLTDWRMTLARDGLRDGTRSLTEIAHSCGYTTVYAFSAAFSRHHGVPPGRWRATLHPTPPEGPEPRTGVPAPA